MRGEGSVGKVLCGVGTLDCEQGQLQPEVGGGNGAGGHEQGEGVGV